MKLQYGISLLFSLLFTTICYSQSFDHGELINGPGFGYDGVKTFDADNDGDLDVLYFPYLYLNDGHGKKQKIVLIGDGRKEYEDYRVEDLDGDKDMDIVVLYKDGSIEIFINSTKGFLKKEQNNKVRYLPAEYAKLYLYDANADGICDIIISGVRGVPAAYIGDTKQQYTYFKAFNDNFPNLGDILGIDYDKNGIQDLLVPDYTNRNEKPTLKVYTFKSNKYVLLETVALTTSRINNIKLIDMDKDGDKDLVYSAGYNGGVYWIERNNKGGLGKTHTLIGNLELEDFQLGDFDSDGDLDMAYFTQQNQYTSINWLENKGRDVFVKSQKSLLPNIKDSQSFVFEDFDGDKIKDVLFYDDDNEEIRPQYTMVLQQKNGLVKEKNTWLIKSDCAGFVFTDLDNNGTKDIVGYCNNELFYILLDSKGKYTKPLTLIKNPFKIATLKCADIDNDGKEDLMVCSDDRENGTLGWFKNEGGLKFKPISYILKEKERLIGFEIMDYDNDGNKDVVVNYWSTKTRGFYAYKNTGKGVFSNTRTTITETLTSFPGMAVWDVNGDKISDLVDYGSNTWLKYTRNGKWEQQPMPFKDRFVKGLHKAKVDKNSSLSYLLLSESGLKRLTYNNGQWENKVIQLKDFSIDMIKIGDINGDGYDDIVCLAERYGLAEGFQPDIAFSSKYSVVCLLNDKNGNFTAKTLSPVISLSNIELQDIDNDGDLDVVTSSKQWPASGITVWKNLRNN